jgi:hypothetical protein
MVKFDVRPMLTVNGNDVGASLNVAFAHNDNTVNVSSLAV